MFSYLLSACPKRTSWRFRLTVICMAWVLTAAGSAWVSSQAGAAPGEPAAVCADKAVSAAAAEAMAKKCRRDVLVESAMSETTTVTAHVNGVFESREHVVPVRARTAAGWAPIDTRLRRLPGGGVAPAVSAVDLRFSRGGDDPLVTLGVDGASLALSWPAPLPVPAIEGDTAVYAEVLSGVDLRVRALAAGFTHILVVKHRAAADNPALQRIVYGLSLRGLTPGVREDGGLEFRDASGKVALSAPQGLMWDSSTTLMPSAAAKLPAGNEGEMTAERSSAAAPGDLAKVAPVKAALEPGGLAIVPDLSMLTGSGTKFPVFIDPQLQAVRNRWAYANSDDHSQSDGIVRVGRNPACCGGVWRSYFEFDVTPFAGKNVYDAKLHVGVTHTSACGDTPLHLWHTTDLPAGVANGGLTTSFLTNSDWLHVLQFQANADTCGDPSPVEGNLQGELAGKLKTWSTAGNSLMTLGLAVINESGGGEGSDYWVKLTPSSIYLTVWYNSSPNPPVAQPHNVTTDCYTVCSSTTTVTASAVSTEIAPWWKLNETSGTTANDSSGNAWNGTAYGGVTWSDNAAALNGTTASLGTPGPVVSGAYSFTISAWAKRVSGGNADHCKNAVTQDGYYVSIFWLGTCGSVWEFGRPTSDVPGSSSSYVQAPMTMGVWTHIIGIYDQPAGELRLYKDGVLQGITSAPAGTTSPGIAAFRVGLGLYNNSPNGYFPGSVSNVQVYPRVLRPNEVTTLSAAGRTGGVLTINPAIVRTFTPTLSFQVTDPEPGTLIRSEIEVRHAPTDTSTMFRITGLGPVVTGSTISATVPAGQLNADRTYYWRAFSMDELNWTSYLSPFVAFRIDGSAPAPAPSVSSPDYPEKAFGDPTGTPGTFTFTHQPAGGAASDVVEFEWWVDNAAVHQIVAATGSPSRTATVSYTPASPNKHIMHVQARDASGRLSQYDYEFWVFASPNVYAHWALDEAPGTAVAADTGNAPQYDGALSPATRFFAVDFGPGRVKDANGQVTNGLVFTGDGVVRPEGPVLDTTKEFTVMAWVKATDLSADRTFLSGDGTGSSKWQLRFRKSANGGNGAWCFSMRVTDGATPVDACTDGSNLGYPTTGVWTHVAAVFNPGKAGQQMRIYVMGDPFSCLNPIPETATAAYSSTWSATGPFVIGRAKAGGANADYWRGSVDDVWAHQVELGGHEICMHAQPNDED